jgi:hypothetical protein
VIDIGAVCLHRRRDPLIGLHDRFKDLVKQIASDTAAYLANTDTASSSSTMHRGNRSFAGRVAGRKQQMESEYSNLLIVDENQGRSVRHLADAAALEFTRGRVS